VLPVVLALVIGACSTAANKDAPGATGSSANTLNAPLAAADPEAFRVAEAALRRDGRTRAGLAQLGPGAFKLAEFMDRTASFALTQLRLKLKVQMPGPFVAGSAGSGGRLAAPLTDLAGVGAVFGAYLMTTQAFDGFIELGDSGKRTGGDNVPKCPCTETIVDRPFVDEVSVDGNPGLITTTMSATVTASGSKVSIDLVVKVGAEVRDASGALLYKISNEGTGHADGDGCPDASGTAHAHMLFGGHEDYFNAAGTKTGSGVSESFGGEMRIRVDDNAKIAGVDISPVGQGGEFMMRLAAQSAAPMFEKVWRSGTCIALLVSPDGGDVEKDSDTTVTVKVKHIQEGNELDKLVEAKLTGVKSLEPTTKQKGPATFHYKAGSADGDKGSISFESVSNRGIGRLSSTFSVGGDWLVSSTGGMTETVTETGSVTSVQVRFKDVKVTAQKDSGPNGVGKVLRGTGQITITGSLKARMFDTACSAPIDRTFAFDLVGVVNGSVMKLRINAPNPPGASIELSCDGVAINIPKSGEGDFYGSTLGDMVVPSEGAVTSFDRSAVYGLAQVKATAIITVVRPKP
jgi:hypothetical protein